MSPNGFETRLLSSLTKVFADDALRDKPVNRASCLRGEVFSFQLAYRSDRLLKGLRIEVESPLKKYTTLREVGLAPCEFPGAHFDEHALRTAPGLYPDPLYALVRGADAPPDQWRAVWVQVRVPVRRVQGPKQIVLRITHGGRFIARKTFTLDVIAQTLPKQKLIHTSWFHADCIASHYGDAVWSRPHWKRIEQFVCSAVDHGVNMLLTPLFTPPLDTEVGGERPTTQLIDVVKEGNTYRFDFRRLRRWVKLADRCGVQYFEMAHFFTQWGAAHCPKIVARVKGRKRRIFGWKDRSAGAKYRTFLDQFLPQLVRFIRSNGLERRVYFHVSDEPSSEHLASYSAAASIVHAHLEGFPFIDALSDVDYYDRRLVRQPVPASNHIEPFVERGIKNLWTYYCVSQWDQVANRFFYMPSARNRILGAQLYKYDLSGFLQWGFNFYYAQYSTRPINPFLETDAGRAFPSGDPFMVYPGNEGPIDSIRGEVFREALQDQRALQLLEKLQGRDKTLALLHRGMDRQITMKEYPRSAEWLLSMRERVNKRIAALTQAR